MEQLAARWAHNPKVVGSSPAPATKKACNSKSYRLYFLIKSVYYFPIPSVSIHFSPGMSMR